MMMFLDVIGPSQLADSQAGGGKAHTLSEIFGKDKKGYPKQRSLICIVVIRQLLLIHY